MILEKYLPGIRDTWTWRLAQLTDIDELQQLVATQSRVEVSDIFTMDEDLMVKKVCIAIVEQKYNQLGEQLIVAIHNTSNKIIAFSWLTRKQWTVYSSDECAHNVIIELEQTQSTRNKITLLAQIIQLHVLWCIICGIPILTTNTVRHTQKAFLKLYEQAGFAMRGSMGYKRINRETI
jgi:hypothetical protein